MYNPHQVMAIDPAPSPPRLRAVYYPYSRCLNPDALKRALLVFDEIWCLEPLDDRRRFVDSIRDRLQWNDKYFLTANGEDHRLKTTSGMPGYATLVAQGVICHTDPTPLVRQYGSALATFLQSDLQDEIFQQQHTEWLQWVDGPHGPAWRMRRERVPTELLEVLSKETPSSLEWLYTQNDVWTIGGRQKALQEQASEYETEEIIDLPTIVASSLLINEALLFASESDLIPFTDSAPHDRLLRSKLVRAQSRLVNQRTMEQRPLDEKTRFNSVVQTLLNTVIPLELLSNLSLSEVVDIRNSLRPELEQFKDYLWSVQARIPRDLIVSENEGQVRKLVDAELRPKIAELEQSIERTFYGLLSSVASKAMISITPTMVVSILAGMDHRQVLGYSAAAAAGAFGIAGREFVDFWTKRRDNRYSPFIFLVELREQLGR